MTLPRCFRLRADENILIDREAFGEIRSNTRKRVFSGNMTTVLPLSGLVGGDTETFRVPGHHHSPGYQPQDPKMAGPPHNSRSIGDLIVRQWILRIAEYRPSTGQSIHPTRATHGGLKIWGRAGNICRFDKVVSMSSWNQGDGVDCK